jgi:hypothetical protein
MSSQPANARREGNSRKTNAAVEPARLIALVKRSLALGLSALLTLQPVIANAQSVSPSSTSAAANQPGVGAAPNGIPLIDIVTPNGQGLSHNKYDDFNVGTPSFSTITMQKSERPISAVPRPAMPISGIPVLPTSS